ncbi:hypothetical protein HSBAA_64310 [Vreelandella sulfidaeris]|uniref:Thioredoxin domain-containing protein n=1 Tax=Vreelandella sulfidaeris TaxID=115553 RepID=A0A455UG72_9GAMM|nr:hypothetical protein HSBAA_64310 [Halomonas sulfidaeris]
MASKSLWLGAGVVAVLVVASSIGLYQYAFAPNNDGPVGGPVEMPSTRGDFSLTQLDDDQVAVLSFGYTHCPDVCPMTQSVKRQALAQLSDEQRERVVPVMITVDPERDTIERMQEYMGFFGEGVCWRSGQPGTAGGCCVALWRHMAKSRSARLSNDVHH